MNDTDQGQSKVTFTAKEEEKFKKLVKKQEFTPITISLSIRQLIYLEVLIKRGRQLDPNYIRITQSKLQSIVDEYLCMDLDDTHSDFDSVHDLLEDY
jgi:hypothetical protein